MNQELVKKLQSNKLKNIFKDLRGMELIELLDMGKENVYGIKQFLCNMSQYSYARTACIKANSDRKVSAWIIEELKFLKSSKEIIAAIDNCYMWLCKVKIIDINQGLEELWELGDICFFEPQNEVGVYIGIDENDLFITTKVKNETP